MADSSLQAANHFISELELYDDNDSGIIENDVHNQLTRGTLCHSRPDKIADDETITNSTKLNFNAI
jgi:hypothetical protein